MGGGFDEKHSWAINAGSRKNRHDRGNSSLRLSCAAMPTLPTLPHGAWPSPLSADALATSSLRLSQPAFSASGPLVWAEGRPAEGGRTTLCRRRPDGVIDELAPSPIDVRSRVHEYGAGAYALMGTGEQTTTYFVASDTQALMRLNPGAASAVVVAPGMPRWRFGDLAADCPALASGTAPRAPRLLAVAEHRAPGGDAHALPDNVIVALDIEGNIDSTPEVLVSGADFYASPTASPDGRWLAWLAWDHPQMPWDAAALHLGQLDGDGRLVAGSQRLIAGGPEASAQQPLFDSDGTLYFLLERDGLWNLHRHRPGAGGDLPEITAVGAVRAELGLPLWQLGTRSWGLLGDGTALASGVSAGVARLHRIDLQTGESQELPADVVGGLVSVGHLACANGQAALLAGFADRASALVLLDFRGGMPAPIVVRRSQSTALAPELVSRAEVVSFATTDGDQAFGFFYAPVNPGVQPPPAEKPPLVVFVHGGPTGATSAAFSPLVQYFTTRGLAVLDVNYRGSTGYGRAYRDRLRGKWGIYDVDDCLAGARAMAAAGRVDSARMAIRGSSAGGYTVLAALVHPEGDLFRAGACLYGISDLAALARDTHKFESRYCDGLIAPWPQGAEVYKERSPISHPDRLRTPVIFFQGAEDKVVPPDQTRLLAEALRKKGIPAPHHLFAGEAHGFSRAATLRTVYEAELSFYGSIFGFAPAL